MNYKMEISIESCRICLRNRFCIDKNERWESVLLDDVDLDQMTYREKYNACTGIQVSKSSKLGQKICMRCLPFLRKMYTFLKICLKSEKILQNHVYKESNNEYTNQSIKELEIVAVKKENIIWDHDYLESYYTETESVPVEVDTFKVDIPDKESKGKEFFNATELSSNENENCMEKKIEYSNILKVNRVKEEDNCICEICGNIYKKRYLLEKHVTTHSKEKNYKCEICGKAFLQQQYLSDHMRRHSGVKNHNCSFCTRKFYTKGKLKEHVRTHTGDRIYKCRYCDSSFCYAHNLKRHELCHTGLKPYLCKHCQKTFRTKCNLDQHFRTDVHKDKSTRIYSILFQ